MDNIVKKKYNDVSGRAFLRKTNSPIFRLSMNKTQINFVFTYIDKR